MALTKTVLAAFLAVVVASIGSFYIGYSFNPYLDVAVETEGLQENFAQFYGIIKSHEGNTLTLKLISGEERTITLTDETPVVSAVVDKDQSALRPGEPVLLSGTKVGEEVVADYITLMGEVQ